MKSKNNQEQDNLVAWLEAHVPQEIPAELSSSIRASIVVELSGITTESTIHPQTDSISIIRTAFQKPSLEFITAAMLFICLGLNAVVTWSSDHRVAALVGNSSEQDFIETSPQSIDQLAIIDFGGSTSFEINISLIQQELNHERIEFYKSIPPRRERKAISPPEEKTLEESIDPSGAATHPRTGIQRVSKSAGRFTA